MENNDDEMLYEIWAEGFHVQGLEKVHAHFEGTSKGKTFKEACEKFFEGNKLYDPETNSYWNCRLFDNETDARKSFG